MLIELFEKLSLDSNKFCINDQGSGYFYQNDLFFSLIVSHCGLHQEDLVPKVSHAKFMQSYTLKYPIFFDCVVIAKCLLNNLSFGDCISTEAMELLVCAVFSNELAELAVNHDLITFSSNQKLLGLSFNSVPTTQSQFFVKFLAMMASWSSSSTVSLVCYPLTSQDDDVLQFPLINYEPISNSPIRIYSPYDPHGTFWIKKESFTTADFQFLASYAKKCLKVVDSCTSNVLLRSLALNQPSRNFNILVKLKSLESLAGELELSSDFKNIKDSKPFQEVYLPNFHPYRVLIDTIKKIRFSPNI
ncbi:hypothetical protein GEMRC1_004563 [Eukaryota sp. GEM-RC1]